MEISKDIIGHWLDLINTEGWIPRYLSCLLKPILKFVSVAELSKVSNNFCDSLVGTRFGMFFPNVLLWSCP